MYSILISTALYVYFAEFNAFQEDALKAHNEYRARHDAPPQTLNKEMNQGAEEWAR